MKPTNRNIFANMSIRHTAVCLAIVAFSGLPGASYAGWFSNAATTVSTKAHTTAAKVAAVPGNAQDKLADVSAKINEIYAQIEENRPLTETLRNGRMMTTLKETLGFIQDMQEDYQQFAAQDVYTFRSDMQALMSNFSTIGQTFGQDGAILDRLDKTVTLIDRMPTSFLYLMNKAVGSQLVNLRERTTQIGEQLSGLPELPSLRELYRDPLAYTDSVCPLVNDKRTAVYVAAVQAQVKNISFVLKSIKDYLPGDLVVTADVVAGGGLTMSKNPSQLPFQVMSTIVDSIDMKITSYTTMAAAICSVIDNAR